MSNIRFEYETTVYIDTCEPPCDSRKKYWGSPSIRYVHKLIKRDWCCKEAKDCEIIDFYDTNESECKLGVIRVDNHEDSYCVPAKYCTFCGSKVQLVQTKVLALKHIYETQEIEKEQVIRFKDKIVIKDEWAEQNG